MALHVSVMEPVCTNEQKKKMHLRICSKTYSLKSFVFVLALGRLHDCKHFAHKNSSPTFSVLNDARELKSWSEPGSLKHGYDTYSRNLMNLLVLVCIVFDVIWQKWNFNMFYRHFYGRLCVCVCLWRSENSFKYHSSSSLRCLLVWFETWSFAGL